MPKRKRISTALALLMVTAGATTIATLCTRTEVLAQPKPAFVSCCVGPLRPSLGRETAKPGPSIYVTVVTNCSDFINFEAHCQALKRHLDLTDRYGLRVDYSFTAPLIQKISTQQPDLFERLKRHGLSYHGQNRPPHPYPKHIPQGESWKADFEAARKVASVWRDMQTGEYVGGSDGGVKLWKRIVGRDPWMDGRPHHAALLAADLAFAEPRVAAGFKDNCGLPSNGGWWMGVLGRPDGVFIHPDELKRYALSGHGQDPVRVYQRKVDQISGGRPLFINLGLHLFDFYTPRGWAMPTYAGGNPGEQGLQRAQLLSADETDRIFAVYEKCLAWATECPDARIITLEQLVTLAEDDRVKPINPDSADRVAQELCACYGLVQNVPLYIDAEHDYFTLAEAFQILVHQLVAREHADQTAPSRTASCLGPTRLLGPGDVQQATRAEILAAAGAAREVLSDGIPSTVALGAGSVNPAQLLLVMARAWLESDTTSFPVPHVSTLPHRWAQPQRNPLGSAWATHVGQFWCYKPIRWKAGCNEERRGQAHPPQQNEHQPPLYILSMMHAEEHPFLMQDKSAFREHARNVRALAEVFHRHGAKLAVQPDWTFIEGAKKWDPDLFTWLIEQGMGVDAHAHATKVSLEGVARKLMECGVRRVRIGNGDFQKDRPEGTNWTWPFAQPTANGKPFFDALNGYKDVPTQTVDSSAIVWRPATAGDWHLHDPETPILYIGSGPIGQLVEFDDLDEALDIALRHVRPGVVNTMHWHDSIHKYGRSESARQRIEQWDRFLSDRIDPLVKAGRVKWATFSEMADAHLELERNGELALKPGEVIPQIDSPLKFGNLSLFVRQFDANRDGAVSREEFDGAPQLFDRFDRDADGLIRNNEAPRGPR